MLIEQIITGGQTGVDRAAMDFALKHKVGLGGWCPKGRLAEDGIIPLRYSLQETPSTNYAQRTRWNIRDSDGVLILTQGKISGGTALAVSEAQSLVKPMFIVDLCQPANGTTIQKWIQSNHIKKLGIGGPRESQCPGIYQTTIDFLNTVLED